MLVAYVGKEEWQSRYTLYNTLLYFEARCFRRASMRCTIHALLARYCTLSLSLSLSHWLSWCCDNSRPAYNNLTDLLVLISTKRQAGLIVLACWLSWCCDKLLFFYHHTFFRASMPQSKRTHAGIGYAKILSFNYEEEAVAYPHRINQSYTHRICIRA